MDNNTLSQSKKDVSLKTSLKMRDMLRDLDFVNADAAKARGALSARDRISKLFDEATFVEIGTYVKNKTEDSFSGVICGYGAISGRLVFAFSQDRGRSNGIDEYYIKKVLALYDMALKNGAPIVGIFDGITCDQSSAEDISSLSGIGKIMSAVNSAMGVVPQIAIVNGSFDDSFALVASMFDFIVIGNRNNYIIEKNAAISSENEYVAIAQAAELIRRLPQNNADGTVYEENNASINRILHKSDFSTDYDMRDLINTISDSNDFIELYSQTAPEMLTGFIFIGGISIGVCANDHKIEMGIIGENAAKKAAKFISFCDSFNIPLLTLVDSVGSEKSAYAYSALSTLSYAYASSTVPKVSIVIGNAKDASYILMGSKSLGADIAYALEGAKIAVTSVDNNDYISQEKAAREGEIDDIIEFPELRKKICAAFEMLGGKSTLPFSKKDKSYMLRGW